VWFPDDLQVLETKENLAGQQELFDAENENDEDSEKAENVESISDFEMDDAKDEISEAADTDAEDTSGSETNPDSDDEAGREEIAAFESKLSAALGTRRGDEDLDASDGGSSPDNNMDDDQMEELDKKLVEIFKAQPKPSTNKREKKDAKEMMINFKGRVLDLLHIYVKRQPTNRLVLSLILPLLRLIRTTNTKHLADKSGNIIRELGKKNKGKDMIQLHDHGPALSLLQEVHSEAGRGGSHAFGAACSQSSLLIAKTLVGQRKETISDVVDIYGETKKRYVQDKKSQVQPSFFTDWNNWCVSARQQLGG
jgi:DNA polymerase phi